MTLFENSKTGAVIERSEPTNEVIEYDGKMMIVEMDQEGRITYTNRKFRDMTGYSKEELVGVSFDISQHPDMPEGICHVAFDAAAQGKIWGGYIKSITRKGEYFWSAVCVQPKYDTSQNHIGYIINKKRADEEILAEVIEEFDHLKDSQSKAFRSEYCGELHPEQLMGIGV